MKLLGRESGIGSRESGVGKPSAVSGQRSAVSGQPSAVSLQPWPWPMATLREWPRYLRCGQPWPWPMATLREWPRYANSRRNKDSSNTYLFYSKAERDRVRECP
ncbi:hypothetical protein BJP36_38765 [Moorena producens JHB]|uniref:Uncharacterized protein n=1 Tax=Moorena producens (strain JHB) TaxID=1454205 RepID=A0A9Q9SUR7_MOOP1|nr:hypothetical protein [Moorena producens]WAN70015.1 hypothetical protein BJP36_38765 [Moorena producens JHB]